MNSLPGHPPQPKYRFPWREGNRFRLLVDGEQFYPAMLEAVGGARRFVAMEMYLFESGRVADRFIDAFLAAAARGVRVHLLLDHFGAFLLRRADRQRLTDGGVRLAFYNPLALGRWLRNLARNHRKLLIVDGATAFTGGAGISDTFDPLSQPAVFWHEAVLEVRGPCVRDWLVLFRESWLRWGKGALALDAPPLPPLAGGAGGRVTVHVRFRRSDIGRSLANGIRRSEGRVWLATAYFVPSWKVRRALRRAARRGVDVRLLLPGPRTDHPAVRFIGRRFYEKLLRDGIRIFEYQPRFLHAKVLLGDDWLSMGSSNFDRWNLHWNLEANQETADPAVIEQMGGVFVADFERSRELRYEEWLRRPWHRHLGEWFGGKMMKVLAWISERRPGRARTRR